MKNDVAYSNGDFIPGAAEYPPRWAEAARAHRETEAALGRARLNVAYGPHEREKLDLFHPAGPAQGLAVFVHGGYWHKFDRASWSHFTTGLTAHDYAVAVPSYPLAPEVRIRDITAAIARAVETAAGLIPNGPIRLTGHSAGGHLVARMLAPDAALSAATSARLARVVPISPLSDLVPLMDTTMNTELRLDADEARAESPLHQPTPTAPVTVWVGAEERPAFLDQARWLAEAWGAGHRIAPGRHHFDVIDDLLDPEAPLTRALLA